MSKRVSALFVAAVTLSACGGDGGEDPKYARYFGAWQYCDGRGEMEVLTFKDAGGDTLDVKSEIDYYSNDNCTGTLLATETITSKFTLTGIGTKTLSTALPPSSTVRTLAMDEFGVVATEGKNVVLSRGATVSYSKTTINGVSQPGEYCFERSVGGTRICIPEETLPAETGKTGLYTESNRLNTFELVGTEYKVDPESYAKR